MWRRRPKRLRDRANPLGTARDANESQRQLVADLSLLTVATTCGASSSRWPAPTARSMASSAQWAALSTEVGKRTIALTRRA